MRSLWRRSIVAAVCALLCAQSVAAVTYVQFEAITVSNTAVGFLSANINAGTNTAYPAGHPDAQWAECTVITDAINIRYDGTAATAAASGGNQIAAGKSFTLYGHLLLQRVSMIRVTTDATVTCHYHD